MFHGYRGKHSRSSGGERTLLAAGILAALLLTAAAVFLLKGKEPPPDDQGPVQQVGGSAVIPDGPGEPQTPPEEPDVSPDVSVPEVPAYDFSQPAPEREAMDNSYFSDAAFVGDSRTDGFMLYSGIGTGKNLTSNGLSVFSLPTKKALTIGGEKYTLLEALALEEYGKVYISLGVNELGYGNNDRYYEKYSQAVDEIRRLQPAAIIYIQGLIPVNEKQLEDYNGNKYNLTNEHLRVYNDLMRRVAEEKQVVYLDLYAEFVDENGGLPEGVSRDGVHLGKDACKQWLAYLQTHTVDYDTLYPDGPPAAEPDTMTDNGSGQA
ncbi:GDSL-type esterase/lipase family protein [Oscillospiraceae bacterium 44-34]